MKGLIISYNNTFLLLIGNHYLLIPRVHWGKDSS